MQASTTAPAAQLSNVLALSASTEYSTPPNWELREETASTALQARKWLSELLAEVSTEPREADLDVYAKVEMLFSSANGEVFEDGMERAFSRELVSIVQKYGDRAMEPITHLLIRERVDAEEASEALRWLGRLRHGQTRAYRLWLLERCLLCSSPSVRDGAGLGLASLDDPDAVPYLQRAISRETCDELREDLAQVLAQLERARPWPSS